MYKIVFSKKANKDLIKLPLSDQLSVVINIKDKLSVDPFSNGKNPKRLKGCKSFRLRVGVYRVLYEIEGDVIRAYRILHRKDAYKNL